MFQHIKLSIQRIAQYNNLSITAIRLFTSRSIRDIVDRPYDPELDSNVSSSTGIPYNRPSYIDDDNKQELLELLRSMKKKDGGVNDVYTGVS